MTGSFLPSHAAERNDHIGPHRNLYSCVYSSIIYNNQKGETTQISISERTDKQIIIQPYTEILLSHKEEHNTDLCYNLDEPQKHDAQGKKPDTKEHISHDCFHVIYPE